MVLGILFRIIRAIRIINELNLDPGSLPAGRQEARDDTKALKYDKNIYLLTSPPFPFSVSTAPANKSPFRSCAMFQEGNGSVLG